MADKTDTKVLSAAPPAKSLSRNGSVSPRTMTPTRRISVSRIPSRNSSPDVSRTPPVQGRALPTTPNGPTPVSTNNTRSNTRTRGNQLAASSPNVQTRQKQNSPNSSRPLGGSNLPQRPPPANKMRSPTNSRGAPRGSPTRSKSPITVQRPISMAPRTTTAPAATPSPPTRPERPVKPAKPSMVKSNTVSNLSSMNQSTGSGGSSPAIPAKPASLPPKPSISSKPPVPTKPPKLPPKPVVLSEKEHEQINEACKKFCNANKQLLAVSRSTFATAKNILTTAKIEFLDAQLGLALDDLKDFNNKYSQFIRDSAKVYDHKKTVNNACLTIDISNFSSIICAALKLAAIECEDESMFRQCLKAITTIRDSLMLVIDALNAAQDKVDSSLVPQLEKRLGACNSSLAGLVGHKTTGPLITDGTRMEIEAAIRAAVVSIARLVNSFNGTLEQTIVSEAKVASCCVAQVWATLNEMVNTNTNLLAIPKIREIISSYTSEIKQGFNIFMEKTKMQVANPSEDQFEAMKANEAPFRALLRKIVAHIQAFSEIDTENRSSVVVEDIKPNEKHNNAADKFVSDPEDIVPPPPDNIKQSAIDHPDDFVPSTDNIWDEPTDDKGRVLYTDSGDLRCSTLNKLIIYITANLDMNKMKTFITTYRSFTTPEILLEKIIQRYHVPSNANVEALPIQLRCCNCLKYLIETQNEDFSDTFNQQLEDFLIELQTNSAYAKFATIIKTTIQKKKDEQQTTKTEIVNLTIEEKIPLSPCKLLFVMNEEEIARQLTLVDFRIYRAIRPVELLNQAWSKAKYKYRAKNVLALVARSTALTMWVSSVILWQETLRGRIRAYTKMVNIAQHMLQLNNFNSLMAILAGLGITPIFRLKFTREGVSDQTKKTLDKLNDLMDPTQSYGNYRQKLHDVDPPCVPFLGTYLTDITFIEDGNPDYIQGLINYRKREMVFSVIREIQQYQQQSYTYDFVNVAHFLTELASNNEEHLYNLSLLREPRGATIDQLP